jgi:hypothetical protein
MKKLLESLEQKIVTSYEQGVTVSDAEKLAGEFLVGQIRVSEALKNADLDARTRKSGLKAIRAALYLDTVQKTDKKPTEAQITAMLDSNELVVGEQSAFDTAEVDRNELERYYDIFANAHVHFRSIAKGTFGG